MNSIRPISLTAFCTTSRISEYVAAAAISLANSLILGLPIAASTVATTVSNGFCETTLQRWTLTVRTSILLPQGCLSKERCSSLRPSNPSLGLDAPPVAHEAAGTRNFIAVLAVEIHSSSRWRAPPPWHCSAFHCAERRRGAAPDSCRPWRFLCRQVPP